MGFYEEPITFGKLFLETGDKIIKRMYKYLLNMKMEDEVAKYCMIKLIEKTGCKILLIILI